VFYLSHAQCSLSSRRAALNYRPPASQASDDQSTVTHWHCVGPCQSLMPLYSLTYKVSSTVTCNLPLMLLTIVGCPIHSHSQCSASYIRSPRDDTHYNIKCNVHVCNLRLSLNFVLVAVRMSGDDGHERRSLAWRESWEEREEA